MDQKRTKYDPIDNTICAETIMIQAIQSLDIAAYMAIESRDHMGLAKIAELWTDIARSVGSGKSDLDSDGEDHPKQEADQPAKPKTQQPVGFAGKGE